MIVEWMVFGVLTQAVLGFEVNLTEYSKMPKIFELDPFDECFYHPKALYCYINYYVSPLDEQNPSEVFTIMNDFTKRELNYNHRNLRRGLCNVDSCPVLSSDDSEEVIKDKLKKCLDDKYKHLGIKGEVAIELCEDGSPKYEIGTVEILVAIGIVLYLVLLTVATVYEGYARYQPEEEYKKMMGTKVGNFLNAFALAKNWDRLRIVNSTPDVERLRVIQGIRLYTMVIVIFCHTSIALVGAPVSNTLFIEKLTEKIITIFLASGPLCVQTFFMISTWLLFYNIFEHMKDKKEISAKFLLFVFVNRLLRLTPTLAIVILLQSTWLVHLGNGPIWDLVIGQEYRNCRKNGWSNLLYINNYVDPGNMCLVPSWYLGIDTQLFIIALVLIYLIKKYEHKVYHIIAGVLGIHMAILFILNFILDYPAEMIPTPETIYNAGFLTIWHWHLTFASLFANIAGLAIGIFYGYIYYKYKEVQLITGKWKILFYWILAFALPLGTIIIPGKLMFNENISHSRVWASFHAAVSRTVFSLGIGMLILGVSQGHGWLTKFTTEWRPTYVLGRITYSAFLGHLFVIQLKPALMRTPNYVNDYILFAAAFGDVIISYIIGLFITLTVELPVSQLQKMLVPDKKEKVEGDKKKQ